jgi:hypothetical protein
MKENWIDGIYDMRKIDVITKLVFGNLKRKL